MIPFLDLAAQYASIKHELEPAVLEALASCQYVLGPEVSAFEEAFAKFCNTRYGVAVNSGTSALHLALLAAGVGPGDEVITVSSSFVATVAAILYTGATPRLVDIDPRTCTLDPNALEAAISRRTKAVIPVHLYGQSADMDPIVELSRKHGLTVIEDAAQAHGAEYKGRRVGSLGDLACFSFYPGKNLGACGEGGIVVTDDEKYADLIRVYRDWGQRGKGNHVLHAFNYRMEGVQGAALRVKFRHLESWNAARRRCAERYHQTLADSPVRTLASQREYKHIYHVYSVLTPERDRLREVLAQAEIQTNVHYPKPIHLQPAYANLGYGHGDLPHSERLAREQLSLPIYPELTEAAQQLVVDRIKTSGIA